MSSSGWMTGAMALSSLLGDDASRGTGSSDDDDATSMNDSIEFDAEPGRSVVMGKPAKRRRLSWGQEDELPSSAPNEARLDDFEASGAGEDISAADCNTSFSLHLDAAEDSEADVLPLPTNTTPSRRPLFSLFGRQQRGGVVRKELLTTASQTQTPATVGPAPSPSTPAPIALKSLVWNFFHLEKGHSHIAICTICQRSVKRGKPGGHLGTTAQISHMKTHHPNKWLEANRGSARSPHTPLVARAAAAIATTCPASPTTESDHGHNNAEVGPLEESSPRHVSLASPLSAMRQPTLAETLEKKSKFPASHPVAKMLTALTAAKLALDLEPFSSVENEGFRLLMAYVAPRWEVPGRHYFSRTAVPELFAEVASKLRKELGGAEGKTVHLTMDMWTSRQGADFMTVTAHWASFAAPTTTLRQHATLCLQPFDTASHKATDVREKLQVVIAKWLSSCSLVPGCVTADNGSNVIAALKLAKLEHIPCFAHVLNLIVRQFLRQPAIEEMLASARKICAHFSRSYAARNALLVYQENHQLPKHHLKTEVPTRWNSTFHMLERLLEQRVAVQQYGMNAQHARSLGGTSLTAAQWQMVKQLCQVLHPFLKATERVSRANASLSEVLPMLRLLQNNLENMHLEHSDGEESDDEKEELKKLADSMLACMWADSRVQAMLDSDTYLCATFVDPRFRGWVPVFNSRDNAEEKLLKCQAAVKARLQTELDLQENSSLAQSDNTATAPASGDTRKCPASCRSTDWWCHCRLSQCGVVGTTPTPTERSGPTADDLLGAYMQDRTQLSASAEPLLYWQEKKAIWPVLARVAIGALTCQPASVQSERVFSAAGAVVTDKRTRLSAENVQRLTFIKMNRHLLPSRLGATSADAAQQAGPSGSSR